MRTLITSVSRPKTTLHAPLEKIMPIPSPWSRSRCPQCPMRRGWRGMALGIWFFCPSPFFPFSLGHNRAREKKDRSGPRQFLLDSLLCLYTKTTHVLAPPLLDYPECIGRHGRDQTVHRRGPVFHLPLVLWQGHESGSRRASWCLHLNHRALDSSTGALNGKHPLASRGR